jgi:methionyl aminopeptidase
MINAGAPGVYVASDGWTVFTRDGTLSAQFEHSLAMTRNGPEVLTQID